MPTEWSPSRLLNGEAPSVPYGLLILNQPLNTNALHAVLTHAALVVCADGGANRLFDHYYGSNSNSKDVSNHHRLPDAVVGDLDSIRPDVEGGFRSKGIDIVKDPDQYSTDFSKCLHWLRQRMERSPRSDHKDAAVLDVVALGGLGGRVDQGFSQAHYLYRASDDRDLLQGRIYLLSEESLTFVLDEGKNTILIAPGTFEENVGIIPVAGPAEITTKGLEWDVQNWRTEFGTGLMSTSNHIRSDRIEIDVQGKRPLFTLELGTPFKSGG